MEAKDFFLLIHPALAVIFVFPLIGIVTGRAWLTRQRRLAVKAEGKSKIPPVVGQEHVQVGRWLAAGVVGIALLGMARPSFTKLLDQQALQKAPFLFTFIVLLNVATIASLVLLYRAKTPLWRGVFATLTGMGLMILGLQTGVDGNNLVFLRNNEWYVSHFYIGIIAAELMVFSLAIVPDIYKDKSNTWRIVHTVLNCVALLLFIGQGMTGARDLLEIPLSWQEPFVYQCDYTNKTCPTPPPAPQS